MLNHNLDTLKELFENKKVLSVGDVMNVVGATTRMTAYKYMKRLEYLLATPIQENIIPSKTFQSLIRMVYGTTETLVFQNMEP